MPPVSKSPFDPEGQHKYLLPFAGKICKLLLGLALFLLASFTTVKMYDGLAVAGGVYQQLPDEKTRDSAKGTYQQIPPISNRNRQSLGQIHQKEQEDISLEEKYLIPYLNAKRLGMKHFDIAEKVFKMKLLQDKRHPHSYPLISANTFSAFADVAYFHKWNRWIVKNKTRLPHELQNGDAIFVRTIQVGMFAASILPKLPNVSFILITSSSDVSAPAGGASILQDPRLIKWFALNLGISHPKMEAIPLGLRNYNFGGRPEYLIPKILNTSRMYNPDSDSGSRPGLVYVNFDVTHHKSRRRALETLKDIGEVRIPSKHHKLHVDDYLGSIARSKFMASPRGNGMDCYRTWEAIMMGAIAIVENSTLNPLHEQGPTIIVNDWDPLVITKEFLLKQRVKVQSRRVIMADYWFEKINRAREDFLRQNKLK